jgi:hypothetical protein
VITFVTIPKPFEGHTDTIQRNAISSWLRVGPGVRVLLAGDETGVDEAAAELGVDHLPDLPRNEHGTPLLDEAFRLAEEKAGTGLVCFVNADILMPPSLAGAARAVSARADRFLVIGDCWNVRVETLLDADSVDWVGLLGHARRRGADALDYFLFTPGIFGHVPPFAVGRMVWDNWLVWKARDRGAVVVDATSVVRAVHQDHSYVHVGSLVKVRGGPEADENRRLAGGGRSRLYSRFDATHRLTGRGLVANPLAFAHAGETARRGWAKLGYMTGLRRE